MLCVRVHIIVYGFLNFSRFRLTEVINGLQARLTSPEYLRTHEAVKPSLEKLMEAAQNGK